ncbi:MAG: DMT family transporter [Alphaproteobacteria bacterium]|nr:MAG: DMT family transporter [Alphaproteobacteria bacterium]
MAGERDRNRQMRLAFLALLAGATGIGFAPIFVRIADVGPVSSAFWRMALALPPLLVWRLWGATGRQRSIAPPRDGGTLVLLLAAGGFFAADLGFWHWSIKLTSVANATLLANLNPVFVALVGFLFLGHRFRPPFLLAMALALGGAVVLMGRSLEISAERVIGDLLGVATAMMYAGYFLSTAVLRSRQDTWTVLFYSVLVTAAVLGPLAVASETAVVPRSPTGWLAVVALALVCQIAGQGLIVHALAHLPPAFSALTLLLQPVVAAIAAWALFGEALGGRELAGALLIFAGILLARATFTR